MIDKKYQAKPDTWWKGRIVRSTKELSNGWATLPKGTIFKVMGKWNGLKILSQQCKCCGIRVHMSKVPYRDLELIEDGEFKW